MHRARIECSDAAGFAARWGEILQKPVRMLDAGRARVALDVGRIDFVPTEGPAAVLAGIELQVADRAGVLEAARSRGRLDPQGRIDVCGVRFELVEAAPA